MDNDIRERIEKRKRAAAAVKIPSPEEVIQSYRDFATPIDFDQLIKDGILAKVSGPWYTVLDWNRLPKYASTRITTVRSATGKKNGARSGASSLSEVKFNKTEKKAIKTLLKLAPGWISDSERETWAKRLAEIDSPKK